MGLGGESGPGPLGAPGPRYGVHVGHVYFTIGYTWRKPCLLAHSDDLGGESGPGPLGAPGPRYGVPVANVYSAGYLLSGRLVEPWSLGQGARGPEPTWRV